MLGNADYFLRPVHAGRVPSIAFCSDDVNFFDCGLVVGVATICANGARARDQHTPLDPGPMPADYSQVKF